MCNVHQFFPNSDYVFTSGVSSMEFKLPFIPTIGNMNCDENVTNGNW